MLREAGVNEIDVAQVYLGSEETAGDVGAARYFSIGTKELGCGGLIVGDGPPTKENVIRRGLASLKLLRVEQVGIFYIHGPDRTIPFEETLEGIDELFKMGKFKKFGLSNFLPDEVEKVSSIMNPVRQTVPDSAFQIFPCDSINPGWKRLSRYAAREDSCFQRYTRATTAL